MSEDQSIIKYFREKSGDSYCATVVRWSNGTIWLGNWTVGLQSFTSIALSHAQKKANLFDQFYDSNWYSSGGIDMTFPGSEVNSLDDWDWSDVYISDAQRKASQSYVQARQRTNIQMLYQAGIFNNNDITKLGAKPKK